MDENSAFDILSGKVDNKVVKFPWQSVKLINYDYYQIAGIFTQDQLYTFNRREMANELIKAYFSILKTKRVVMIPAPKALDPTKGSSYGGWVFGSIDAHYDFALAVSLRSDGRFNVSSAFFYKLI